MCVYVFISSILNGGIGTFKCPNTSISYTTYEYINTHGYIRYKEGINSKYKYSHAYLKSNTQKSRKVFSYFKFSVV